MQLVTNERLAKRRFRLGTIFHLAALLVLMAGLVVSLQIPVEEQPTLRVFAPYVAILVFLFPYYFGKQYLLRYGPKNRFDGVLAHHGKGLDNRYTLLSFTAPHLPDYLIVGPGGVFVLVPRSHAGVLVCQGDRWQRQGMSGIAKVVSALWGTPLGNPARDVQDGTARVAQALQRRLGDEAAQVPVHGLVVFTHPQVKLQLYNCTVQATAARNLKNHLRGARATLSAAQITRVREALAAESRQ